MLLRELKTAGGKAWSIGRRWREPQFFLPLRRAALAGCEMGLRIAGVPLKDSGLPAAMAYLAAQHPDVSLKAA